MKPAEGEDRVLVPSPKVATYDLQPEMSAAGVLQAALDSIEAVRHDLLVINFANPDMVGHTGDLDAAVRAVETVDGCVGRLAEAVLAKGGKMLVTADHGNCEVMWDDAAGSPHTAHTTNLVPVILVGADRGTQLARRAACRPCAEPACHDGNRPAFRDDGPARNQWPAADALRCQIVAKRNTPLH